MKDDRDRRLAQLRQAYENGILDEDTYQAALAGLDAQAPAQAEVTGSGAAAQQGGTAAGARGVAVAGSVYGDIYTGPPPDDPAEALAIYRRVVAQACGHLPLRGVDVGAADAGGGQKPLGLAHVYVDLDTRTQVEAKEGEPEEGKRERPGERDTRPLSALEAVAANPRLALLGDPGGGKTTFVNHLAHCLALSSVEGPACGDPPDGWPDDEAEALPIRVILRDFARSLPDPLPARAEPNHLWAFIVTRLEAQKLEFAEEPLCRALEEGRALLLLDGLDEVPTAAQRAFVRDAVTAFVGRYHADNRALVTCRVLSYQPPATPGGADLRLPDFPTFELAPFDEAKIDRFIGAWYDELARTHVVRTEDAPGLARQLRQAVRRPDLWRLAPNPLLLTVMALVHTHKGRLPDARALLYEDTVDILLWRWEQIKAGGRGEATRLRQLLLEAGRTDVDLKRVLAHLAYEAHAQVGAEDDREALADIGELRLQKALAALKGEDFNWARLVIETMKLRAGLLLERAPEVFTFPHRTFQEYLAGAHLASLPNFARQGCELAEQGAAWREVILLAAGRLVYRLEDSDKPLALVGELCPAQALDEEVAWYKAWLAGDVLREVGANRVADSALGRDLLARVQGRLVALLEDGRLAPRQRAAAGDTLARLGDPRPEVTTLEGMQFCQVPAGPFWMGSSDEDEMALDREKPLHQLDIPYNYWMARYPVTVAQFRAFVDASGYQPGDQDSLRGVDNHPVVWVSWREARAFCDWLTESWRDEGLLPADWLVRLPTEAEWEKAARGGVEVPVEPVVGSSWLEPPEWSLQSNGEPQRRYPWGADPDPERANYGDTGIGTTSAVGCFPGGVSPYGVLEMSGNAYEWTRSLWGEGFSNPDFKYPYNPEDGRENVEADANVWRVLRGGAFNGLQDLVRCAFRFRDSPSGRYYYLGFRLVVAPGPPL